MINAYTIGNHKGYDRSLATEEVVTKKGRYPGYEGGGVWRTAEDAQTFIDNTDLPFTAKVYGLILPTDWETDISPDVNEEDGVHRLLHDAQIVHVPGPNPIGTP